MLWRCTRLYIKHGKEKWHHLTNISTTEIPKNLAVDISLDICTSSQDKGFRYLLYLRWCTISQSDPSCISRPTWSTATRFPKLVTSPGREIEKFQTGRERFLLVVGGFLQPIWKICSSTWRSSSTRGENTRNVWSCQHLDIRLWPNYLQLSQVGHPFHLPPHLQLQILTHHFLGLLNSLKDF